MTNILVVLVCGSSAVAAAQTALVFSPCPPDHQLVAEATRIASDAGIELFDPTPLNSLRPAVADVKAATSVLETARSLFFAGDTARAETLITQIITEVERATPVNETWPLLRSAWLLRAQAASAAGRSDEVTAAVRRILDSEPDFVPDRNEIAPSLAARFDVFRRELATQPRVEVQTSGAQATIFIDGRARGPSPQTVALRPGAHRVFAVNSLGPSFLHTIEISSRTVPSLVIDVNLEANLGSGTALCVQNADEGALRQLAATISVKRLFLIRSSANEFEGSIVDMPAGAVTRRAKSANASSLMEHLATGKPIDLPDSAPVQPAERSFRPSLWGWAVLATSLPGLVFGVLGVIQFVLVRDSAISVPISLGGFGGASALIFTGAWMLRSPKPPPVSVALTPGGVVVFGAF